MSRSDETPAISAAVARSLTLFDPAAMPAGAEFSVGYFRLASGEQRADVVLIDSNSCTCTCTSTRPDRNGPPDGYGQSDSLGLLYGRPGPAGS